MSASNWAMCPRCMEIAEEEKRARQEAARDAYGKVPPDEYLAMLDEAGKEKKLSETLREDYDIGIDDDSVFYVNYRGDCDRCGLSHRFKHEEKIVTSATESLERSRKCKSN